MKKRIISFVSRILLRTGVLCVGTYLVMGVCNDILFGGDILCAGDDSKRSLSARDPFVERYIKEVNRIVKEYEEIRNRYASISFSDDSSNSSLNRVNGVAGKSGVLVKGDRSVTGVGNKIENKVNNEAIEERIEELGEGNKYFVLFVASANDTYDQLFKKCGFGVKNELVKNDLSVVLASKIGRKVVIRNCGALIEDLQKRFSDINISFDEETGTVVFHDFYTEVYFLNPRGIEDFRKRAPNHLVDENAEIKVYSDGRVVVSDVKKGHEKIKNLIKEINEAAAFQDFKYRYEVLCEDGRSRREYTGWIFPDVSGKLGVEGELQVVKRNKDEVWIRVFLYRGVDRVVPFRRSGGEEEIKDYVGGNNLRILLRVKEEVL